MTHEAPWGSYSMGAYISVREISNKHTHPQDRYMVSLTVMKNKPGAGGEKECVRIRVIREGLSEEVPFKSTAKGS